MATKIETILEAIIAIISPTTNVVIKIPFLTSVYSSVLRAICMMSLMLCWIGTAALCVSSLSSVIIIQDLEFLNVALVENATAYANTFTKLIQDDGIVYGKINNLVIRSR